MPFGMFLRKSNTMPSCQKNVVSIPLERWKECFLVVDEQDFSSSTEPIGYKVRATIVRTIHRLQSLTKV